MKLFLPGSSPMIAPCCSFPNCSPIHSSFNEMHRLVTVGLSWHVTVSASLVKSLLEVAPVHNTMRTLCCICWTCFATHSQNLFCYILPQKWELENCYAINSLHSLNEIVGLWWGKDFLSPMSCFLCLAPLTTCSARQGITRKITVKEDCAGTRCFPFRCTSFLAVFWCWTLCCVCA